MPGPDPICSSRTPQLPPPELDAAMPTGVAAEHAPDVTEIAAEVAVDVVGEVIGEAVIPEILVGGAVFGGAITTGAIALTISSGLTLHAVVDMREEGAVRGMLASALRAGGSPEERAMVMGYAAGLAGLSGREIESLRATLPRGTQEWFVNGLANFDVDAEVHSEYLAEARTEYLHVTREFGDGIAAAVGGWDDTRRGEAFRAGRERVQQFLDAHPCEAEELRGQYRAALRDGFRAADAGTIDHRRELLDPAYRAGVEHFRHVLHERDTSALEAERRRIGGVSVRELAGGRIAG